MSRFPLDLLVCVGIAILGFTTGYFHTADNARVHSTAPLRGGSTEYKFINPLLLGSDSEVSRISNDLNRDINNALESNISSNNILSASVYYRDLNTGQWIGVNENEKYAAASMYKVVTMLSLLKKASKNPAFIGERVMGPGLTEPTTIGNLIYAMIVYSNNEAKNLLESILKPEERKATFSDFGLIPPRDDDDGDTLSPKEYSVFFRSLYNGNYLGHELSETALDILSRTEFSEGLTAAVASTTTSHKFGYREFEKPVNGVRAELHDCGIIYYPQHPYFLCVMTKGTDQEKLARFIQEISAITYRYTKEKYPIEM